MTLRTRLLCGPLAFCLFVLTVVLLPLLVPGYNQIRQTVSEIGETDSPARIPFAVMLCIIAAAIGVFASALWSKSKALNHPPVGAWFTACAAISVAGIGIFAYPHPLHNVFGMSELIGYLAPFAFAISWRHEHDHATVVRFSWLMGCLVWTAVALNLATLDRHGALFALERPFYGLVQRALFVAWFVWSAGMGLLLMRRTSSRQTIAAANADAAAVSGGGK